MTACHHAIVAGLLAMATASAGHAAPPPAQAPLPDTIGVATQDADGTLVRYPPGDPNYERVRRHVGPIPTGGSVFVRPFPD